MNGSLAVIFLVETELGSLRLALMRCSFKCPLLSVMLKREDEDSFNLREEFDGSWWNVHCLLWLIQKSQQNKNPFKGGGLQVTI